MQYLTIWDVVITPFYLLIIILLAKWWRNRHYPQGHPLRKYFLPGLYVKLAGAIFIGLVYQFYYGYGDTLGYFDQSKIINSSLDDSFAVWAKLLLRQSWDQDPRLYKYITDLFHYDHPDAYMVCSIAAVLGLFNGTTFLPIALLFATLSYSGIWAMYRTFFNIYPQLSKQLAVAFLFIPSTFVWGSGIFKDTICLFGLGWMTYCTFRIFINRDFSVKNLLLLAVSFYLIAVIKIYILLAFLPALCLWLLMTYSSKIRSSALRWTVNIGCIAGVLLAFNFLSKSFAEELDSYSIENITKTMEVTSGYLQIMSGDEGSAYDLGKFDPTVTGILSKFPAAVTVTLFRPFPWEAKKAIVLLPAMEALVFLFFTLRAIVGIKRKAIRYTFKDPTIIFCLVYSLIFAFAVGISTGNFGTLSRYKIPCLSFYALAIILIDHQNRQRKMNPGKLVVRRVPQTA